MRGQRSESVEDAAGSALGRGLDFLETAVEADGAWPSRRYDSHDLTGPARDNRTPFTPALGVVALDVCDDPRAEALRSRSRAFLYHHMEYPGVWRYWPHMPPDLDDTAMCSLAAGPHPWLLVGRNLDRILSYRDHEGRFLTWMIAQDGPDADQNDVDSVVNANTIAWLGDHPDTRGAQRWIETLIEEHREAGSTPAYPEPMDLHVAVARASCTARPAFARLRPALVSRIMDGRKAGGDFGDVLRTAQALSALDMLGGWDHEESVRPSVERLIEAQRPDGSWPECLAWQAPLLGFASEALTTAFCIEALERFLRPRRGARSNS